MGICVYTCTYQVWLLVLIKVDENINSFLAGTIITMLFIQVHFYGSHTFPC